MSSGSYDIPHLPSTFPRSVSRKASGSHSAAYDRPPVSRRSLSPGPSLRTYDSYVPLRPAVAYRDEHSSSYRPPNIYRSEYPSNSLYSRSPSPDRYVNPVHSADSEGWDRQSAWQISYTESPGWKERKPAPPSPTTSVRSRGQRDDTLATRMFEPSENWKQSHTDRPGRNDASSFSPDRYSESSSRGIQDPSAEGLSRSSNRSSVPIGGDRYRPAVPHKSNASGNVHSEYDSYRPGRDNKRESHTSQHPEIQPANSLRRDLLLGGSRWDYHEPAYGGQRRSRFPSGSGSPEWGPRDCMASSPTQSNSSGRRQDPDLRAARMELSRHSSRSSIASTHASDLPPAEDAASIKTSGISSQDERPGNGQIPGPATSSSVSANKSILEDSDSPRATETLSRSGDINRTPFSQEETKQTTQNDHAVDETPPQPPQSPPVISASNSEASSLATPSNPIVVPQGQSVVPQEARVNFLPFDMLPSRNTRSRTSAAESVYRASRSSAPSSPIPSPPPQISKTDDTSEVLLQLKPLFRPGLVLSSSTPSLLNAKSLPEALHAVVTTRLLYDQQPRDEIVNPVLLANQAKTVTSHIGPTSEGIDSTPDSLIEEVLGGANERHRLEAFEWMRPFVAEHFKERKALVSEKIQRLSKEYRTLHDKWRAHCATLSDQQRSVFSSEHEGVNLSGRTTRRTTAITDAVRSDLEMEQIIASLGNDDAMDPNYMSMRNAATIPDMLSVTQGQVDYVFDDTNHLIENPSEYFASDTGIDDWTTEEKRIFIDRFAQFPKQFGIIAESIPHKTAAQCVDYYYLHKKRQIDFRKVVAQLGPKKKKRRGGGKKKGNALLTDIAQHDAEVGKNLSSFVVPSRVAKGRRGVGRPPKIHSTTSAAGSDRGAGHSATATPQPEPRSSRFNIQFLEPLINPATPEPDGRLRRRKPVTQATASTSVSTPPSVSVPLSATVPGPVALSPSPFPSAPSPAAEPESEITMAAPTTTPAPTSVLQSAPVAAPTLPPAPSSPTPASLRTCPPSPPTVSSSPPVASLLPPPFPVSSTQSGSSSRTKVEEDDMAAELDARPVKRPKRGRKQVKSVAIIHEEPPSPPLESALGTPAEFAFGQMEPSSVLTKATKILSEFEARRQNGHGGDKVSARIETNNPSTNLDGDLANAEKSRWT